jgi:hypothetical protein
MQAPELLIIAVRSVLRTKAREGKTTKRDATLAVLGKIDKAGGPTKFGIGAAAMRMALTHVVDIEVTRQLKMDLTDHETKFVLPASTPMDLIAALGKVPRWIAINDGTEAIWRPSLQASPDEWLLNSELKEKKARQTEAKANVSIDIARFLMVHKFISLSEAISKGA